MTNHPNRAKKTKAAKQDTAGAIVAYKAFNPDWTCNGYKFEVGKTFKHTGKVAICESGFHACTVPFDCWTYYEGSNTLARVTAYNPVSNHDSKIATAKITIEASLSIPEWIKAQVETVLGLCKSAKGTLASANAESAAATGDRGHAAATGYSGHAAATGDSGHAAATGDSGHAAATGDSGHAAATGYRGHAAATGDRGHAAATGKNSVAASLGLFGTVMGGEGCSLVLQHHEREYPYEHLGVKTARVGENGIKPDVTYKLDADGNFVEA